MDNTITILNSLQDLSGKLKLAIESLNLPNWTFEETDRIIAKHGWYIPTFAEMKLVFTIMKLYNDDKNFEAEKTLVKYFKSSLKQMELKLINQHSDKKEIIKEAFLAHRKKMYYSSTILFLSQADGICDSIIFTGSKIKKIKDKKDIHPIVKIVSESNPLTDFYDPKTKNSNYFSDLNRHGVMHGISNDYGNEINSLKALSLVCFVSDFSRYSD